MTHEQALALVARAHPRPGETWADLGAGRGVFTRAIAELLGETGTVYAVDRDAGAVVALRSLVSARGAARIAASEGDLTTVSLPSVDVVFAANALHFVPADAQTGVLARFAALLAPDGRVVLVEYDREGGNPWVPYPISRKRLTRLAREAGFQACEVVASTASEFGGEMYMAVLTTRAPKRSAITSPVAGEPG